MLILNSHYSVILGCSTTLQGNKMKIKLLTTTATALLILTNFSYAGGDIAPQEPQIDIEVMEAPSNNGSFYLGLGYSYMQMDDDTINTDITGNAITALAGYKFLPYLAVEGRYSATLGDLSVDDIDRSWDMSNIALYLKPQYTFNQVSVYGLLGYGEVTLDNGSSHSEDGFQWGLGASFAATDDIDVFVDYTRLYDDDGFDSFTANNDIVFDSITVGVNYNF
jgi:opacity protein-like surface antigen